MKYLVQRPRPDELLSSVWLRTRRVAGIEIGALTCAVTGRKFAPGFLGTAHIADLARLLEVPADQLLRDHTLFPYAAAFVEPALFGRQLETALATGLGAIGASATTQGLSKSVRFRRLCRSCAQDDTRRFGVSYWHRSHHLPGVLICCVHKEALRVTHLPTSQPWPWLDVLPHECRRPQLATRAIEAFEQEMAAGSAALLWRPEHAPIARPPHWYREQLVSQGLLSENRPVDGDTLIAWAEQTLKSRLKGLGLTPKDRSLRWLPLMVRPCIGIPFSSLKHRIFQTLLATSPCATTPVLDRVPTGPGGQNPEELDRRYARNVAAVLRRVRAAGERIRVCDALTAAGCWSAYRHDRESFPRLHEVVRALRTSFLSVRRVDADLIHRAR